MKTILPWLVAVLALAAAGFFYSSDRAKSGQIAALQKELESLEHLRAENAELRAGQTSADELQRLRKNTEELLRLRNEVRQLREEKQQMTQQAQSAQAAAQREVQAAQASAEAARAEAAQLQAGQMEALARNTNALLTPEDVRAFQARYGVQPATPEQTQTAVCINNLRQIDAAKAQWALENGRANGSLVNAQDLTRFFTGNAMPICPGGGGYTLNTIGYSPLCNIPGHAIAGR